RHYHEFHYLVVRAWEQPVGPVLEGGVAILPMAPLADVPPGQMPAVIRRMRERVAGEVAPREAAPLWSATYVLMGLRYPTELVDHWLEGVHEMKESATYQKILAEGRAEGRAEEARRILLRQGRRPFGPPPPEVVAAIEAIADPERIERLAERM